MEHEKKLAFIAKMTKMGLDHIQHLDTGGALLSGPAAPGANAATTSSNNINESDIFAPLSDLNGVQNKFTAGYAPIQAGTNTDQLNKSYTAVQLGLDQQQGLIDQTRPGVSQGLGAQSTLSNQLSERAAGNGPNPAQAALNQSTGQNVATTAAALAGARGSSGNVGLMSRQIGQQGAATQQQAVGQAATLQAQQEIAAQEEQQRLAATQIGQGANATTTFNQEQQNEQNILQGANTSANNAAVSMQGNVNNVNAGISSANQTAAQNSLGGLLSGGSSALSFLAKGGLVKMDKGGNVLDANARKQIAPDNFALPNGRYPIHDINHARNALARVSQNGTPAEKKQVKAAVHKKYPSLAGKKMADGGDVEETSFEPTTPDRDDDSFPAIASTPDLEKKKKGGGAGAIGGLIALLADGGTVREGYLNAKKMASGGYAAPTPLTVGDGGAQSYVGQWVNSNVNPGSAPVIASAPNLPEPPKQNDAGAKVAGNLIKTFQKKSKSNSNSPTSASSIPSSDANAALMGAPGTVQDNGLPTDQATYDVYQALPDAELYDGGLAAKGGNVNARSQKEKAQVKGDSLKNDKIPALLSEGEVVMDRETLSDPGPLGQMARAVAKHIEKRNKGKKQ